MQEQWRFYKTTYSRNFGYKQYYVSNLGRVMMNGELIELKPQNNGYIYLCHELLHRIVAKLFIENYNDNLEVDHINTVKTDNRSCNLICCSRTENLNNPLTRKHNSESHIGQKAWNKGKHSAINRNRNEKGQFC